MPKKLEQFLRSLTPLEADELWCYFDSCSLEAEIKIVADIALSDPAIAEKNAVS